MNDNLRRLRKQSEISQEKLCDQLQRRGCDIGSSTCAKYEANKLNIRASVIVQLKRIYSCSYDEFFVGLYMRNKFCLHMKRIIDNEQVNIIGERIKIARKDAKMRSNYPKSWS